MAKVRSGRARTDADAANLLQADYDERDRKFLTGSRTSDGFFEVRAGLDQAIDRGLSEGSPERAEAVLEESAA